MESRAVKWWGWGWEDRSRPVESLPVLWAYVQQRLQLDPSVRMSVPPIEQVRIPPSLLSPDELGEVEKLVGEGNLSVAHADRVAHAVGRGYRDLVRLRSGNLYRAPDAVLFPEDEGSVRAVLDLARRRRYAVVPFGGGTSVVGGVEPLADGTYAASLTLDLRRMHRIKEIDEHSGLVTAEPGVRGPLLEEALSAKGLTLGHFPQSWEFSTLGGWIATRAAGGVSNRYGRIDDLVVGLRFVSPTRVISVRPLPGEDHGPDLKELVLGSEGTLGVITEATLRVHPIPTTRRFASRLFRSFGDGIAALRAMAKDGSLPDMAYLSDEEETRFAAAQAGVPPGGPRSAGMGLAMTVLGSRGYSLHQGSLLLMEFEGSSARVAHRRRRCVRMAVPSASLGGRPARRWYAERFEMPYLRDSLIDHGVLVDTVETAASWSNLPAVYAAGGKALQQALWETCGAGLVMCHVSHVYPDGASLYFTFFGKAHAGKEAVHWEAIKDAVTPAFVEAGGALSHHHGIGADHAPYLRRMIGEDGLVVLNALKRELDPEGIMNPGKLMTGSR
ncbi:MAG TPA: FAD-binding oxidoreductase [Thermoplasmata archaeon]|nr:FAD-binding oxidoreductase [Thermoplasmata archaeon]